MISEILCKSFTIVIGFICAYTYYPKHCNVPIHNVSFQSRRNKCIANKKRKTTDDKKLRFFLHNICTHLLQKVRYIFIGTMAVLVTYAGHLSFAYSF